MIASFPFLLLTFLFAYMMEVAFNTLRQGICIVFYISLKAFKNNF